MQNIKNLTIFFLTSFILVGCFEKLSYSYLMQHPKILSQKITDCQATDEKTKAEMKECEIVLYAAANMSTLISEQQENPEKFGQRIMDLEMVLGKLKKELQVAHQAVEVSKEKGPDSPELQTAKQALDQAQKNYQAKREELKVLLAVVGMNSPE